MAGGGVLYTCEGCGARHTSMWAAAYCCDPWPEQDDERDVRLKPGRLRPPDLH
jgi:hypothetical protein